MATHPGHGRFFIMMWQPQGLAYFHRKATLPCFSESRTPRGGEKSNMPQQDRHEGQLAGGDSNRSSDPLPCSTLATTTGRQGYLEGFDE
eukprot:3708313-Rhodomonas_salina.1